MPSAFTPESASAQFVQSYPSEPDDNGKVLAMQFTRDFTWLKALLPPLRDVLETLADPDRTLRDVKRESGQVNARLGKCAFKSETGKEPHKTFWAGAWLHAHRARWK